jgi:hypothetical protein
VGTLIEVCDSMEGCIAFMRAAGPLDIVLTVYDQAGGGREEEEGQQAPECIDFLKRLWQLPEEKWAPTIVYDLAAGSAQTREVRLRRRRRVQRAGSFEYASSFEDLIKAMGGLLGEDESWLETPTRACDSSRA